MKPLVRLRKRVPVPVIDRGGAADTVLLCGMGRSGTTWVADLINYDGSHRVMFEPFLPNKVTAASGFEYMQYLRPDAEDERLANAAREILSGRVRDPWVDQELGRIVYRRRIVKDIRCNLMLAWLRRVGGDLPTVLLMRHPLQVVASWRKLGWGVEKDGSRTDLEGVLAQRQLLEDFPIIEEAHRFIDPNSYVEQLVLLWCILYHVPLKQLENEKVFVAQYEALLEDPEGETRRLFAYLGLPFDWPKVQAATARQSSTNFHKRDLAKDKARMINGWKQEFSEEEIERARAIVDVFGKWEMGNGKWIWS